MGWMEFVTSIVGQVLSWPVAIVVLGIVLRKSLSSAFSRLRQVEGFGGSATFAASIAEAEIDARVAADSVPREVHAERGDRSHASGERVEARITDDASGVPSCVQQQEERTPPKRGTGIGARFYGSVYDSPEGVILRSYDQLTRELHVAAAILRLREKGVEVTPVVLAQMLAAEGAVEKEFLTAVQVLSHLRNRVAHGGYEPTNGQALAYVESVDELLRVINHLIGSRVDEIHELRIKDS